ncbi:MAG TPA: HAMP domain-containing sensor histidine kinase [Planctomycetota bacterium]
MDYLALGLGAAAGFGAGVWLTRRRGRRPAEAAPASGREDADLAAALAYLPQGVLLLDGHGGVLRANPAAATLLGSATAAPDRGEPLAGFAPQPALLAVVERSGPDETVRRSIEVVTADDQRGLLELTIVPAGAGRRLLLLRDLHAADILDRKRRDFVANASHELQTPIAAIIGLLDLIEEVEAEERPQLFARARRNAESLASLTRDLLGLARAEDPHWRPAPKELAVAAELAETLESRRERAAAKGLAISSSVEPGDLRLLADPLSLATVVGNLVDNAITYTASGKVEVSARETPEGGVMIEVRDTGPGIDPAVLPRIFERFFRGDPARSRASGGTGLGLAIVRNLVGRMGGRIAVSSRPGEGSSFRVELPANPARPLQGAGQAAFL